MFAVKMEEVGNSEYFFALDGNDHFVEMPLVGKSSSGPSPGRAGTASAEPASPFRDSLERDLNATFSQQIFDMTQAQRKAKMEPNRICYDHRRENDDAYTWASQYRSVIPGLCP
jgi:hypothetical protein